ncbi:hypothetical protein [Acinetobacter silvestris]
MLSQFLLYSLIINYMILFIWFFAFIYALRFSQETASQVVQSIR